MGQLEQIAAKAAAGNVIGAATELGRGLMRGHRPSLKLGYSHENAALAAIGRFEELAELDALEVRAHLLGFAFGLHKAGDDEQGDAALCELYVQSQRLGEAFEAGQTKGWDEAENGTPYPAGLPS